MTVVIAKRFGERIVIASDTMITNESWTAPKIVPGRMKAIILNNSFSVAYAGFSDRALIAIRQTRQHLLDGANLETAITPLVEISRDKETDFIFASHLDGAELRKITDGTVTMPLSETSIGDPKIVRLVNDKEADIKALRISGISAEEQKFRAAFSEVFRESGVALTESVGGVPIFLTARLGSHHYEIHAGVTRWDRVNLGVPESDQQAADLKSGLYQWKYSQNSSHLSGVAVFGLLIPDANAAYIYTPLQEDEARSLDPSDFMHLSEGGKSEKMQQAIEEAAESVGGGVPYSSTFKPRTEISFSTLGAIANAAKTLNAQVVVKPEGLWIQCASGSGALANYGALDDKAVEHICDKIHDMNDLVAQWKNIGETLKQT